MGQPERNEFPHVWDEGNPEAIERYRDLTVRCVYCDQLLIPDSNYYPGWNWSQWRETRANDICIGIMNLVLDKWQPPVVE